MAIKRRKAKPEKGSQVVNLFIDTSDGDIEASRSSPTADSGSKKGTMRRDAKSDIIGRLQNAAETVGFDSDGDGQVDVVGRAGEAKRAALDGEIDAVEAGELAISDGIENDIGLEGDIEDDLSL
jgi:hypothetical protein